MRILVDTSVWFDFFNGHPSREAKTLAQHLHRGGRAVPPAARPRNHHPLNDRCVIANLAAHHDAQILALIVESKLLLFDRCRWSDWCAQ